MKKVRVLVGMSGGVDSAVSAYLLKEQGYEVVAGFMKNYADESNPNCHTRQDRDQAIKVAQEIGVKDLVIFDFREEYEERILNYIYNGYKSGITPNPDILCNNLVKFDLFLHKAMDYGFDYIATGHYARINKKGINDETTKQQNDKTTNHGIAESLNRGNNYLLLRGIDYNKDQSYFLSKLNQYQLSKSLFPIGGMYKSEVRELAKKIGLSNANRPDSQGLCFVGNVPMKEFLKVKLPIKRGNIIDVNGNKVGEHDGAWFWTIGQSRGLDLNKKAYVVGIDVLENIVKISYNRDDSNLLSNEAIVKDWHRIGDIPSLPAKLDFKIRYRQDPLCGGSLEYDLEKKQAKIVFEQSQRGLAPGQSIVAYDGEICLGGGIII